ncbi:MAG: DegT/DnrJ/EryC1/StrS family aminotransferase [Flavobacteriales bacterium]
MIPVNVPIVNKGNEEKYLVECIRSGFISSEGPFVKRFEDKFAEYCECQHGVAVCNGTVAIEVAFHAIGIKPGDEVIMPSFTIVSCVTALLRVGGVPVLVDIDPENWCMDTKQVEAKITPKTKAILAVDMYGSPVEYDDLFALADKYKLVIVEDFAESQGSEYYSKYKGGKWLKAGSLGHIGATSFYANKIITTGEGGMVTTNNPEYAEKARNYRNMYFIPNKRFFHEVIGYNYRMTNVQAAIGLAQVEQIDKFVALKRKNGDYYRSLFSKVKNVKFHPVKENVKPIYWMYSIELDDSIKINSTEMRERLRKRGVDTRPFFIGMHEQPALNELGLFVNERYPLTERAYDRGFYVPSGMELSEAEMKQVVDIIQEELNAL